MLRQDDFNPDQPREANGQFGSGGGGKKTEETSGQAVSPALQKAHGKYKAALAEYTIAKQALAEAKASGIAEKIAAAQATHKYAMNKTSSAKHVMGKLLKAEPPAAAPKVEVHKVEPPPQPKAPEPAPAPPSAPAPPPAKEAHPHLSKAEMKYQAALKEYAAAKEALAAAKASGNAEEIAKAAAQHKYAMNKTSSAKHVIKKLTGNASDLVITKSAPDVKPTSASKPVAAHLTKGSTVKVAGKTEHNGPLVGTVLKQNKEGTHSLVLQLGKGSAEWHANEQLSSHTANSAWAKEQVAIGKGQLPLSNSEDLTKKVFVTMPSKPSEPVKPKPTPQVSNKSKGKYGHGAVAPEKAGIELALKAPTAWGNAHYSGWANSLPSNETQSIVAYTGSAYGSINSFLRGGGNLEGAGYAAVHAKNIASALSKAPPLPHDTHFARGMNGDLSSLKAGMTYEDKGFMSTSVGPNAAFDHKDNILFINAPKGSSPGAYLVQSGLQHEKEFLMQRGTKVKVTKVEMKGGKRHIYGELIVHNEGKGDEEQQKLTEEEMARLIAEEPEQADLSDNPKFTGEASDLIISE